jgi:hypothetical protein
MIRRLFEAWKHDRVLTPALVRQHFVEGCERCKGLFQQTSDWRLVNAVAQGYLRTYVLVLCPTGKGKPERYPSVIDVPDLRSCSCGELHEVTEADIEIMFDVREPA